MERENFGQWENGKRYNGGSPDKYPSWVSSPVQWVVLLIILFPQYQYSFYQDPLLISCFCL